MKASKSIGEITKGETVVERGHSDVVEFKYNNGFNLFHKANEAAIDLCAEWLDSRDAQWLDGQQPLITRLAENLVANMREDRRMTERRLQDYGLTKQDLVFAMSQIAYKGGCTSWSRNCAGLVYVGYCTEGPIGARGWLNTGIATGLEVSSFLNYERSRDCARCSFLEAESCNTGIMAANIKYI